MVRTTKKLVMRENATVKEKHEQYVATLRFTARDWAKIVCALQESYQTEQLAQYVILALTKAAIYQRKELVMGDDQPQVHKWKLTRAEKDAIAFALSQRCDED